MGFRAVSFPATATLATVTVAAGPAGMSHVATGVYASFTQPATAVGFNGSIMIRDGASGAGTILWQQAVAVPAIGFQPVIVDVENLNIIGTAATAMTLEFNAAGSLATQQSVVLTGFDMPAGQS